jgi:protein-tyrosine phosphatase
MRAAWVSIRSRLRAETDRWLHASRRRDVQERLRRIGKPQRLLVVCQGNLCRSPYLAALLTRLLPDTEVTSAGLIGAGRAVPPHALTLAAQRGVALAGHRSRLVTRDLVRDAQIVIVMDPGIGRQIERAFGALPERVIVAGDLDPLSRHGRAIRDPWRQPIAVFAASFDRLERCAAVFVKWITRQGG